MCDGRTLRTQLSDKNQKNLYTFYYTFERVYTCNGEEAIKELRDDVRE